MAYNGWTNYETWRIHIEQFDGTDPADVYGCAEFTRDELKERLQETLLDHIEESVEDNYLRGYLLTFLEPVNWGEIADHLIEQFAEDEDTEDENND